MFSSYPKTGDGVKVLDNEWYTYVTLHAGGEELRANLRAVDPDDPTKFVTVGEFTVTPTLTTLTIKLNLSPDYSYGLKNGEPEIYIGVCNEPGDDNENFFINKDISAAVTRLNAADPTYRDPDDHTKFVIPLNEAGREWNLDRTKPINIFVNGVMIFAPEGYETPEIDIP